MADFNSSLPVRTEAAGDVIAKIADANTPAQQLAVNADGSINITDNAGSITVDATDLDIRDLSAAQDNVAISDGSDTLEINADGSINITDNGGSITVDATDLDIRDLTHVSDSVSIGDGVDTLEINADGSINITDNGGSLTVDATDLDIRDLDAAQDSVEAWIVDEAGNAFSNTNPLPVVLLESEGVEVNNYSTASALAASGTSNHDYTVTALKTLQLTQIFASASAKLKIEVQIETGVASGTFNTRFVGFNSTANPNIEFTLKEPIAVAAGVRVRVIRTNKDNQAQDVYSTICGHEV